MDSWSQDQLRKMQAGGNGRLNAFFKQYGVDKYTDISEKYNSRPAEVSGYQAGPMASQAISWAHRETGTKRQGDTGIITPRLQYHPGPGFSH
jgi:hypothetical protein